MHLELNDEMFLNPTGSGGGKGESGTNITTTQTNPVVPEDMKGIADALAGISEGTLNAPVNLGAIPGLDAPKTGPLTPQASMGNMFSNPAYQMGASGMGVTGQGRVGNRDTRSIHQPRSYGDLFAQRGPRMTSGAGTRFAPIPPPNAGMGGGYVPPPTANAGYGGSAGSNQTIQQFLASLGSGGGGGSGLNPNQQANIPLGGQG